MLLAPFLYFEQLPDIVKRLARSAILPPDRIVYCWIDRVA